MTYRDKNTQALESLHARNVFFGDESINDVPEDKIEEVKRELKENGLSYLYTDDYTNE